ncbi:MAG: Sapep family Mn(2+)-dependent dipeptidase [Clostridia bacterium]|nr:Sapep family Mn(2+)-dependent dipeptidase [Clostridia bacterium]
MDQALERSIDAFIESNKSQLVEDIAALIAIDSVASAPAPGAPNGVGPAQALDKALAIAERMGMAVKNCEGQVGYAELGSENTENYLATITHVDIVPAGDGWSHDPFTLREEGGYLIGRGVADDKGPAVLCLYALKYLKEANIPLKYAVRALMGVSEETGMADMKHYLAHYPAPVFAFTPDADFPVCNGEKGGYSAKVVSAGSMERLLSFSGGFVTNAVPDRAQAVVAADIAALPAAERISLAPAENGVCISASGISGHASRPEGTVNALGVLAKYLLDNALVGEQESAFLRLMQAVCDHPDGSGVGAQARDDKFDPLTMVVGTAGCENGRLWFTVDSRYPTTTDGDKITACLEKAANGCALPIAFSAKPPFYISADSPAIRACIDAYNEVTGENKAPFTIGGGTYARVFPAAVSFGPEHMDRPLPDFVGPIHGVNEGAALSDLLEALKIYILALVRLQAMEL